MFVMNLVVIIPEKFATKDIITQERDPSLQDDSIFQLISQPILLTSCFFIKVNKRVRPNPDMLQASLILP